MILYMKYIKNSLTCFIHFLMLNLSQVQADLALSHMYVVRCAEAVVLPFLLFLCVCDQQQLSCVGPTLEKPYSVEGNPSQFCHISE